VRPRNAENLDLTENEYPHLPSLQEKLSLKSGVYLIPGGSLLLQYCSIADGFLYLVTGWAPVFFKVVPIRWRESSQFGIGAACHIVKSLPFSSV
jgi:hypothetical protein